MDKPIHAKPSLYAFYFEILKEIGKRYGYNIVLHGSMARDLDLIAIPWSDEIGDTNEMLKEFCDKIGGEIMPEILEHKKPHGRIAKVININRGGYYGELYLQDPQTYIDISIIPTK